MHVATVALLAEANGWTKDQADTAVTDHRLGQVLRIDHGAGRELKAGLSGVVYGLARAAA